MAERVYLCSAGAVSGFGAGVEALFDGIFAGRSAVRPLERLASVPCHTRVAAEVPRALVDAAGPPPEAELPFFLATLAAEEALRGSGGARDAMALVLATTKGDLSGVVGPGSGLGSPARLLDRLAARLGIGGERAAVSCACASGVAALALAGRWIRAGRARYALVVGVDALSAFIVQGFSALLALSPDRCRPFDVARRGLSLGEGAGAALLSSDAGLARGIELAGWGGSNDATHVTAPNREGLGLALAIERALGSADLAADAIDYVHLHGTGTAYNDAMELAALRRALPGSRAACSGTKAQTGHTLGAAGVIEALIAAEALRRGIAPGNLGLEQPDSEAPPDLVRAAAPLAGARAALKVSAGFGGINEALVLARCG